MSIGNIIVSSRQINGAFNNNHESTLQAVNDEAEKAVDKRNPLEAARMLAGLYGGLEALEAAEKIPGVLVTTDHPVASLLQTFLAKRANEEGKLEPLPSSGPSGEFQEAKFDTNDLLGWIGSFFNWWKGIKSHTWLKAPPAAEEFGNTTSLALLGDWGTGMYGAPVSSQSIEKKGYKLLLHLGDVYYSGDDDEVRERFLGIWPKIPGSTNRALNSNHEMYTGGHAYFELTLKQFQQPASYFALQNDYWMLVGLDSAYKDHNLTDDQINWLHSIINASNGRKIILFSHHQPISHFEKNGPKLIEKLSEFITARKIFAWYWGHEHRCILYEQHPLWGMYGRCVGHGGMPYFRDHLSGLTVVRNGLQNTAWRRFNAKNMTPPGLVLDGPNQYVKGHEKDYGPQGYMVLDFSDEHLNERVLLPDGTVVYEQPLI